jgi:hypothetical protein
VEIRCRLSYKCWRQRFGSDPGVIGRDIIANGRSYTLIGVAAQGFSGTEIISAPDLWFQWQCRPKSTWATSG